MLVPTALHRPDAGGPLRPPRQRALLDGPPPRHPARSSGRHRPVRRWRRARRAAPAVRPLLAQGPLRPGTLSSIEPYARLYNQGYIQAAAFKDERGIYVEAAEVEGDEQSGFTFHGEPVTRECGQDGQEPQERRLTRRDVRAVRRRHASAVRDVDGAARRVTPVGDPRCRGSVPLPAAPVAEHRRRGDRRLHGRRHSRRRRDAEAVAPHDRDRAHRHGCTPLQHGDRETDRTEQPRDQVGRDAPGGRRADGR